MPARPIAHRCIGSLTLWALIGCGLSACALGDPQPLDAGPPDSADPVGDARDAEALPDRAPPDAAPPDAAPAARPDGALDPDAALPGPDLALPGPDLALPQPDAAPPDAAPPDAAPPPAALDRVASLVVLGDSISDGGGTGPRYYALLENNNDARYPEWAGRDLRSRNPDLRVQRRAESGSTTAALLGQVDGIDPTLPGPVAVVVTSGGNDIKEQMLAALTGLDALAIEGVRLNVGLALDAIAVRLAGREVRVYLANIYDPSDGRGNFGAFCRFARDFGALAVPTDPIFARWNAVHDGQTRRTGQVLVDLHAAFYGHGFNAADRWYEDDCTHPNRLGHHRLRALFWAAITGEEVPF